MGRPVRRGRGRQRPEKVAEKSIGNLETSVSFQPKKKKKPHLMFGWSSSSPKTKTPGASRTCLTRPTAAAPLVPLARRTKASFCEEAEEGGEEEEVVGEDEVSMRTDSPEVGGIGIGMNQEGRESGEESNN